MLHCNEQLTVYFFEPMDLGDIRMIQLGRR